MTSDAYHLRFQGRLGNQLFQYCRARAYCAANQLVLHTPPWDGQLVFDINDPPADPAQAQWSGYCQRQCDLTYTRSEARSWLPWRQSILERLESLRLPFAHAHLRYGDYVNLPQYVVVTEASYHTIASQLELRPVVFVREEQPAIIDGLPAWLPDFYRLASAPVLLRANSSFSWWAHVLALDPAQHVYAPIITNRTGIADCPFIEGNWPRFLDGSPDVTDLHLRE